MIILILFLLDHHSKFMACNLGFASTDVEFLLRFVTAPPRVAFGACLRVGLHVKKIRQDRLFVMSP